ncbi:thioester reductase domain-containing protein [Cupriavidus consociatus]|uniref:thioester reductase domain-containing protein n=1 Tax=Cupriavidus consociatus TaxID=2821357 RepID=UPI001AE40F10|nr:MULTISPECIES: thioester reductase domain-containing protein [unclassified Cupriavidus]MBP0624106.1 thioester reductase domain-containing protein [Cupriavidus sp. LEh25]MDK2660816.1 thioester reductase domain-containing protein [Cupriavidus sp. LEh21]
MKKNVDTIYYLTPMQRGMLHHSRLDPASGVYVEQFSCVLTGVLDVGRFRHAWETVANRHDVLRTLFIRLQAESPMQVVCKQVEVPFALEDWRALATAEQDARFDAMLADDRVQGFDWSMAPLMRLWLAELGPQRYRFLWTYHHAILDGWSMPVLLEEVFRIYGGETAAALPPKRTDFRDYVAWLRKQDPASGVDFWSSLLAGYRRPLEFAPSMRPDARAAAAYGGERTATVFVRMPVTWATQAAQACRTHKLTLNALCQGAWSAVLARYAGREDIVYGMVLSGRPQMLAGAETMAGLFINTLPIRVRLEPDQPVADWLRALQTQTMRVDQYVHSALTDVLQRAETPRQTALFDTIYVFENYPGQGVLREVVGRCGLSVDDLRAVERTNYALALIAVPEDGLAFQLTYDRSRLSHAAVTRLADQYRAMLERIVHVGGETVAALSLAAPGQASIPASAPAAQSPAATSFLALLDRYVDEAPSRCAYVGPSQQLDFTALRQRVHHAIGHWAALGYRPGDRAVLLGDDEASLLVMLLSGMAAGVDCLLPDADVPRDALLADVAGWAGPRAVHGIVSSCDGLAPSSHLQYAIFDVDATHALPVNVSAVGGACSLVTRDEAGDWMLVRYREAQIVAAAERFAATYPVRDARAVAVAGGCLTHAPQIWTTLAAIGAGGALHSFPVTTTESLLQHAATGAWHCVCLDGPQTRQLGRLAGSLADVLVETDYWLADAGALTWAGARSLSRLAPQARRIRETRWPPAAMAHVSFEVNGDPAGSEAWPSNLGQGGAGFGVRVLDVHGNLTGLDAFGQMVVTGPTVPDALLHNGMDYRRGLSATADSEMLHTGMTAWLSAIGISVVLPDTRSALSAPMAEQTAIEAAIAREIGVSRVALVERLSADGDWELALFHAAREPLARDGFEVRLKFACERTGIEPGNVTELDEFPLRGAAIDREALLRGDLKAIRDDANSSPVDAIETALHAIWCALLKRDRIGTEENYFELGGDSLQATVMLYQVEERLSVSVPIEAFIERPTIAALSARIRDGGTANDRLPPDLAADAVLAADIVPAQCYEPAAPTHVLLTGATGFLGVHLLAELLNRTEAIVYCLVRAADTESGTARLQAAMRSHGLWDASQAWRVVAVPGELGKPSFGWTPQLFADMAQRIDTIYHNGATVNFIYPYISLKAVNVTATEDVLRFACTSRIKPVHYISTVGVLDRMADDIPDTLNVTLHERLTGGYEQSKWVAEQLVAAATTRGLPATIYRPSRIVGHSVTGNMNTDDLFCRLIKGIVLFGKAPVRTGYDNILPVDLVSRIVVQASLHPEAHGKAVHVVNPNWNDMDALLDLIEALGYSLERLDYETWLAQLATFVRNDTEHPLAMLIPVLKKLNPVVDPSVGRRLPISTANLITLAGSVLEEAMQPVDEWLRTCFQYFRTSGYLPAPGATVNP